MTICLLSCPLDPYYSSFRITPASAPCGADRLLSRRRCNGPRTLFPSRVHPGGLSVFRRHISDRCGASGARRGAACLESYHEQPGPLP